VHKYFKFALGINLLVILFSLFTSQIAQQLLAFTGILSLGILHGANDLKIIAKQKSRAKVSQTFLVYIGVVLLGIFFFYFFPVLALISFVGVSCYHFGEQHWESIAKSVPLEGFFYCSYGAMIFALIFFGHYTEVAEVIDAITGHQLSFAIFSWGLSITCISTLTLGIALPHFRVHLVKELLLLALLIVLMQFSNLVLTFGFYFVVWHSIPSLRSQLIFLYGQADRGTLLSYLKSALWYWILALAALGVVFFYFDFSKSFWLPLFFSFLAAITFPHALVMGKMFQTRARNEV